MTIARRKLLAALDSAAAAWPLAARAQQTAKLTSMDQRCTLSTVTTMGCLQFVRTAVVALAVSLILIAAPAFAQVKWSLPSAYPIDNFHTQNLEAFTKDLVEATGGKLSIKVYPNASLLPVSVIKSAVRMGRMQIGETLISLHDNEDPIFGIDVVPFLATSYDEAHKLWEASKPFVERKLAEQGLMALFAVPWPPQGIFASKEINEIADMKDLSWRVYNASTQRIAEIVGAYPITIQAADLRQALATNMIGALMTSGATGYDIKVWDKMSYFYDTRAWLPKNVTLVNRIAFDQLEKRTQESMLKAAAAAEVRGWWWSQDRTKWYMEQLAAHGIKVLLPTTALRTGLQQIGERLTGEWLMRSGAEGLAIIDAYRKLTP
jgi:TRAP-type C4-dicarboxylate transport system substrate-binding protein